jgi:hypothetical protein
MPVFVIKAKDRFAPAAVEAYRAICENAGSTEQAHQVALAWLEIRDWQKRNPDLLQFPEHPHVPVQPAEPPLWRFDVPEVPAACVKGGTDPELTFVQVSPGRWRPWSPLRGCLVGEPWPTREILEYAPLVECPDPRAAS